MVNMARQCGVLVACVIAVGACVEGPQERFEQARSAALKGELDAYTLFFTTRSAEMIRGLEVNRWKGVAPEYGPGVYRLLPEGDVREVEIAGNHAKVSVKDKRALKLVHMTKQGGLWVIDLFALGSFWDPLMTLREDG